MAITYYKILLGEDDYGDAPLRVNAAQIPVKIYWEAEPPVPMEDVYRKYWTIYWYEYITGGKALRTYRQEFPTNVHSGTAQVPSGVMDVSKIADGAGLQIEYWKDTTTKLATDEITFEIYGQVGDGVNWDLRINNAPTSEQYVFVGEHIQNITATMNQFASSDSATPVLPGWTGEEVSVWGYFDIGYSQDGQTIHWYNILQAKEIGLIGGDWVQNFYVSHQSNKAISAYYNAQLHSVSGFLKSGRYRVDINYWHHDPQTSTLSAFKSSNYFIIYDRFAGAAFHIANITAAQYKQGDPDPLHGMPPYTVTLADDTVRQEYTIPLESIHIDWDDPYSDTPAWSISNPGTSAITIPPHVYTDTNTHVIRMTCVDKRGNTTTAGVSFAPSKQPRIILPPTLNGKAAGSTISMSYPALMAGTAYNAGSPAPQTEWSYVLQGSSAGYYSGSKIGDYAEFSLLAAGTYTVTAKITDDTIILGTYTWTVKVGAEPVSTAQDMPMQDFSLWVLDGETPVDACRQHTCPQYTRNYQGLDTVSFEIPEKYPYAKHLQEGDRFLFGFGGAARLMQVTYRRINAGIISIAGQTAFPDRVAVFATRSASDGGYDIQRCSAEAIIRYFIFTSAAPDPYTSTPRTVDIMMHGTNQDLPTGGDPVTYSARYDNILDIVTSICKTSGLGFSVAVRNTNRQNMTNSTQVHIIEGTNRTYSTGGASAVLFSDNLKNCRIESEQSAQTPTVAVVAGAGTGQYRQHTYYDADGNNNPSITGYQRRESFVDAGESADAAEQKRIAMLELREAKAVTVDIEVLPTAQYELGRDYDVGDIVSVWLDSRGGITDLQIYAADVVDRDTGREIHLHLGSRVLTAPALIAAGQRKNTYARK